MMKNTIDTIEDELKTLLKARRNDWRDIIALSNVSYSWLWKFVNGDIPNPGVQTLRDVRDALMHKGIAMSVNNRTKGSSTHTAHRT